MVGSEDLLGEIQKEQDVDAALWFFLRKFCSCAKPAEMLGIQDSDASVRYEALCSLQKIVDRAGASGLQCIVGLKFLGLAVTLPVYRFMRTRFKR